jgi:hypothetical protein
VDSEIYVDLEQGVCDEGNNADMLAEADTMCKFKRAF